MPGAIFRGNGARKMASSVVLGDRGLLDRSRKSLDRSDILVRESPVVALDRELDFGDQILRDKEETIDLNTLLQFNEDWEESKHQEGVFKKSVNSSILNRHQTVRENILNLPKSIPSVTKSFIQNLKVLSTSKILSGLKAYTHIWRWLKTQPLSVIKLNLTKASEIPNTFGMVNFIANIFI
jgi:hypothetical protein